jgi:hypothetical protein
MPPVTRKKTGGLLQGDRDLTRVRVVDIEMSFGSMVVFMVKAALAAIPALIILVAIGVFAAALLAGFASGFNRSSALAARWQDGTASPQSIIAAVATAQPTESPTAVGSSDPDAAFKRCMSQADSSDCARKLGGSPDIAAERSAAATRCMSRGDYMNCTEKLGNCVRRYPNANYSSEGTYRLAACLRGVGR